MTGEATIKIFPVKAANYARSWKILIAHYNNNQTVINFWLTSLFHLRALFEESVADLKDPRDKSNDAAKTLAGLRCLVQPWKHVLVFMVVKKLGPRTCTYWDTSIGDTTKVPALTTWPVFRSWD